MPVQYLEISTELKTYLETCDPAIIHKKNKALQQSIPFTDKHLKEAANLLLKIAKLGVDELNIPVKLVDFLILFMNEYNEQFKIQGYSYCESYNIMPGECYLIAGMLMRYIERMNIRDRVVGCSNLYLLLSQVLPIKILLNIDSEKFYSNSLSCVLVANMQATKKLYENLIATRALESQLVPNNLNHTFNLIHTLCATYCSTFEQYITKLFSNDKFKLQNLQSLSDLITKFPFMNILNDLSVPKTTASSLKYSLNFAAMMLYALDADKSEFSKNALRKMVMSYCKDKPLKAMFHILEVLKRNQIATDYDWVVDRSVAMKMSLLITEFLRNDNVEIGLKISVLRSMKEALNLETVAVFGNVLATEFQRYVFDATVLTQVYDLRLGLHDFEHFDAQIGAFVDIFHPKVSRMRSGKNLVTIELEKLNNLWAIIGGSGLKSKRLLLTTQLDSNVAQFTEFEVDSITKLIRLLQNPLQVNFPETLKNKLPTDDIKSSLSSLKLENALLCVIDAASKNQVILNRLTVTVSSKLKDGCYTVAIKNCSLMKVNADNWIFADPELPQEYIRFNKIAREPIAKYLKDYAELCIKKIKPMYPLSLFCEFKENAVVTIKVTACSHTAQYMRRSDTPYVEQDDELATGQQGIARASSANVLSARRLVP